VTDFPLSISLSPLMFCLPSSRNVWIPCCVVQHKILFTIYLRLACVLLSWFGKCLKGPSVEVFWGCIDPRVLFITCYADWVTFHGCAAVCAADYRKKCRCRTNFSPAFQHLPVIFQYHIPRITPSAAVYGHAGCITFQSLQFGRALGFPFTTTNQQQLFKC
jgi:hypothetical protein